MTKGKRPRKQDKPVKNRPFKEKAAAAQGKRSKTSERKEKGGPIWARPQPKGPIHPELDAQLAKPFLSTVYVDKTLDAFRYPHADPTAEHAITRGLHRCMRFRFFGGTELPAFRVPKGYPKRLASSKVDGSRADAALDECIRTGLPPPEAGKRGCSAYATAVWNYWREHHHRPVLSQLPVIIVHANVATAGDYFTVHTCPFTGEETLWLWELKTGWPQHEKRPDVMDAPLGHVWLTPENRWLLQVELTKMAYERELGLKLSGQARVINAYMERDGKGKKTYTCKVRVLGPEEATPKDWPKYTDMGTVYQALKKTTTTTRPKKAKTQ